MNDLKSAVGMLSKTVRTSSEIPRDVTDHRSESLRSEVLSSLVQPLSLVRDSKKSLKKSRSDSFLTGVWPKMVSRLCVLICVFLSDSIRRIAFNLSKGQVYLSLFVTV